MWIGQMRRLSCLIALSGTGVAYGGPSISPTFDPMAELAEVEAVLDVVADDLETAKQTIQAADATVQDLRQTFRKWGDASMVVDQLAEAEERLNAVDDNFDTNRRTLAGAKITLKRLSKNAGDNVSAEFRSRLQSAIQTAKSLETGVDAAQEECNQVLTIIARFWEEISST